MIIYYQAVSPKKRKPIIQRHESQQCFYWVTHTFRMKRQHLVDETREFRPSHQLNNTTPRFNVFYFIFSCVCCCFMLQTTQRSSSSKLTWRQKSAAKLDVNRQMFGCVHGHVKQLAKTVSTVFTQAPEENIHRCALDAAKGCLKSMCTISARVNVPGRVSRKRPSKLRWSLSRSSGHECQRWFCCRRTFTRFIRCSVWCGRNARIYS